MALGAARHKRKKIERLMYPPRVSAPWLGPMIKLGPGRGRGHKYGNMNFSVYRREEQSIGPGPMHLAKLPYIARVCIGKRYHEKQPAAGYMRSQFSAQTGDKIGCEWGSGKTPTKALARATMNLGKRLAKTKRGR